MYMDEGLDTGDILLQRKIDILPMDTGGSLHDRLAQIAPDALLESLQLLGKKIAPRVPQNNALATYAPKLNRDDGKIDWAEGAEVIERKVRAFNPWPGAFTTVAAKSGKPRNLKIFSASIVDLAGEPGEILPTEERSLVIAASDRALSLEEVQPEGKRRMTSAEFLRGFDVASAPCR
jgi:methionyl-tRNA formyltransferase